MYAIYEFNFESELPRCQEIVGYEIEEQGGTNKLTYPSVMCNEIPCLKIDVDTS